MTEIIAGDILLFKPGGGMFSKVISWGTGSPYCHVAVCVSGDMHLGIEAMTRSGVRAIDLRKFAGRFDVFRVKEEFSFDLDATIAYLVDKLNTNYDYLGVTYLGILKLIGKVNKNFKKKANRWQKEKDYFCSELCYEAFFLGGGLDIVPKVDEADITSPGDIAGSGVVEQVKR